jgi:uncharacterized protein with GYD domain
MGIYILASYISSGSLRSPGSLESLAREVMNRVREECPDVHWLHNFAVCGPYDYIDVLDAPTLESAMKVSVLTRTYGRARTDLWPALAWTDFKKIIAALPRTERAPMAEDIEGD